jgi:hypothetical protein
VSQKREKDLLLTSDKPMAKRKKKHKLEKPYELYQKGKEMIEQGDSLDTVCGTLKISRAKWRGLIEKFEKLAHPAVYVLSSKYGPPKVDLRDANILDDYGDESYSEYAVCHYDPLDVTRKDLDAYPHVYPFMGIKDLMFYLYPNALEFEKDQRLNSIDSFLYTVNSYFPKQSSDMAESDIDALKEGLLWIYTTESDDYLWNSCSNLRALIEMDPKEDY